MRVLLDHAFPEKVDYLRVAVDAGVLKFYFSLDGQNVLWLGKIEKHRGEEHSFSDAEYFRYREEHPVERVLEESPSEVIVKTRNGVREHWLKPRWILRLRAHLRRGRPKGPTES
jgi:hypothetical protein